MERFSSFDKRCPQSAEILLNFKHCFWKWVKIQIATPDELYYRSASLDRDKNLNISGNFFKYFHTQDKVFLLCFFPFSVVQNPNAHPRPASQDLAGFWDMLQLSIENISMKFDELHQLKANNWKQMDPHDKKVEHCRFCMLHLKPCTNTGQIK